MILVRIIQRSSRKKRIRRKIKKAKVKTERKTKYLKRTAHFSIPQSRLPFKIKREEMLNKLLIRKTLIFLTPHLNKQNLKLLSYNLAIILIQLLNKVQIRILSKRKRRTNRV